MLRLKNCTFKKLKTIFANILSSNRPIRLIIAYFLIFSGLHKFVTISMHGYRINFSRNAVALVCFVQGEESIADKDFYERVLRKDDVVVDVGSNIGTRTLLASCLCPNGRVISVEPHPRTFAQLSLNCQLNGVKNVILVNSAVGSRSGTIFLTDLGNDDQNMVDSGSCGIPIKVSTLDQLIEEDSVRLLKVDVEGFEIFVFEGARNILSKTEIVYFESWESHCVRYGHCTGQVIDLLNDAGFTVLRIENGFVSVVDKSHESTKCEDLVGVREVNRFIQESGHKLRFN